MSNAIKKVSDSLGIYEYIESRNTPDYPTNDWEINPDITNVSAIPHEYWKYDGTNIVVEMSQAEKDAVDAAIEANNTGNTDVSIYTNQQTYLTDEIKTITLPKAYANSVIHVVDPNVEILTNTTLLSPAGVGWDPGNVSTGEANLNNGIYTDLVYNNSSAGNTSGIILGLDMGAATTINAMKMWDYTTAYYNTSWEFIGTNDATAATYTVIFAHTQTAPYLDPHPYVKTFTDQSFRYYGLRCVTSFNVSYTIWRELELYTATLAVVEKELSCGTDYMAYKLDTSTVEVVNLSDTTHTLKTIIVGN